MKINKIFILYSGGTIGMQYKDNNPKLWLEPRPLIDLLSSIPDFKSSEINQNKQLLELTWQNYQLTFYSFSNPVDSSAISPADWQKIASTIYDNYQLYDGFVVLHGTDTMSYSASALSFMFAGLSKAIVFTGANLPISFANSDAWGNMQLAIKCAAADSCQGLVSIAFENYALRGNCSTKMGTKQNSYRCLKHENGKINLEEPAANTKTLLANNVQEPSCQIYPQLDAQVMPIYLTPSFNAQLISSLLELSYLRAYIFMIYGSGNMQLSPAIETALKKALQQGKYIGYISQCPAGRSVPKSYNTSMQLVDEKIINLSAMTLEASLTKFMWALANVEGPQIKDFMENNQKGELPQNTEV